MARLAHLLVILTGSLGLPAVHGCNFYREVGQDLMLPLVFDRLDSSYVLRWTHNNSIVFYRQQGLVTIGNTTDIFSNGSLLLKDLQHSSAGYYQANVLNANYTPAAEWSGRVCVIDPLPKPQLSFACDFLTSSVDLNCHVPNPQGLEFSWAINGKYLRGEKKQKLSVSLVKVKVKAGNSFTCSAANAVRRETSDIVNPVSKGLPPKPEDSYCFSIKVVQAVFAGGAGLVVLLLTVIIVMCCRRQRRQGHLGVADGGALGMRGTRNTQELGCDNRDYETMLSPQKNPQDSERCYSVVPQTEGRTDGEPSLRPVVEEQQRVSPVPKPRTKSPQTQMSKL